MCPVDGCLRLKPGLEFLMCKVCWKNVPVQMRRALRQAYRDIWKPKSGRWVARARKALGSVEFFARVDKFNRMKTQAIQVAHIEEMPRP